MVIWIVKSNIQKMFEVIVSTLGDLTHADSLMPGQIQKVLDKC